MSADGLVPGRQDRLVLCPSFSVGSSWAAVCQDFLAAVRHPMRAWPHTESCNERRKDIPSSSCSPRQLLVKRGREGCPSRFLDRCSLTAVRRYLLTAVRQGAFDVFPSWGF